MAPEEPLRALARILRAREPALLVLDDCEHVQGSVRTLVAELVLSLAVLQAEAARAAARSNAVLTRQAMREAFRAGDRLLVHLVDRPTLMRALRTVEQSA